MSLLDKLRAEAATMTDAEKAEMAKLLGVAAPVTPAEPESAAAPGEDSVCLQCGLEYRYNRQRTPRIAAASDDGSDDGWGVAQGPTGLIYCVQCRTRTRWGPRPAGGIPLPGEPPKPELRESCTHRDSGGELVLCRVATSATEHTGGYVMGEGGMAVPRTKTKAGRARFMCRICGQHFDAKRDTLTRTGWMADMDKPIAEGELPRDEIERAAAVMDRKAGGIDPDLEAERAAGDQVAGWRAAYGLPLAAFNIRKWGKGCAFSIETVEGVSHYRAPSKHFPRVK